MTEFERRLGEATARSLLERVRGLAGESTRGAVCYRGEAQSVLYLRDDVREAYADEDIESAIDDLVLEAFGDPMRLADLYRLGDLEATARWFEEGVVVHFPYSETSGVAVSFDHGVTAALGAVISTGAAHLDGR